MFYNILKGLKSALEVTIQHMETRADNPQSPLEQSHEWASENITDLWKCV